VSPDCAGSRLFNTLGNIAADPLVGLLFIDFATGALLHLAGQARKDLITQRSPRIELVRTYYYVQM